MAHVPQAWNDLLDKHRRAQVAHGIMKNLHQPQTERDRATADYTRAVDGMFAAMETLSEANDTGRITLLLSRKERA